MARYRRVMRDPTSPLPSVAPLKAERLDKGFRADVSTRDLAFGEAAEISNVRFEKGGIRREYGTSSVGPAYAGTLAGVTELYFLSEGQEFHRFVRLGRTGQNLDVQTWDGTTWTTVGTVELSVSARYLSITTLLERVVFADGTGIWTYYETIPFADVEDDFPFSNLAEDIGESTWANFSQEPSSLHPVRVNYDIDIPTHDFFETFILKVFVDGVEISEIHILTDGSDPYIGTNKFFEIQGEFEAGDELRIDIFSRSGSGALAISLHGHDSGDAPSGLQYKVAEAPVSTVELLSVDAPKARFLFSFGDRLVALWHDGDPQTFSWCADGDLENWTTGDSGQIFLIDTRADSVDPLMGGCPIGDGQAAVFRRRSIMRTFETQNPEQALAVVHWIDHLGTDSPFSIQQVTGGVMFLGSDREVYFLSLQALRPVGGPIRDYLIENVRNLETVDSAFSATKKEYYLGIQKGDSLLIDEILVFSLDRMVNDQIVWRKIVPPWGIERLASVATIE